MVSTTFRRRTSNASKPKLPASLDDDDDYKFDPGVCFAQQSTWDIKTPPNGTRKRVAGKRSSDDMDPLSKAQCLRTDIAKRPTRPVSRRGLPDQSWKRLAAPCAERNQNDNDGKRCKRDNPNRLGGVAHAARNHDEHIGPSISKDYTIPKKGFVNTERILKLAREKTHEASSPLKHGNQAATFARHVSEGLRKNHQHGMIDLSEETDPIVPLPSTSNDHGKGYVHTEVDDGGGDSTDSHAGYETQESNSSFDSRKSNKSRVQRDSIHSDRAVCSSPSKTVEDDDIGEVIPVEVAPAEKYEQIKTLGSNPSRKTRPGKIQLTTPPQSSIRGLFDSVRRTSHNLWSPEPQVEGICRSMSDEGKIESVLAIVRNEPVRTEAPALSTAERALRQFTQPSLTSNRRSFQPLKLSKANGKKGTYASCDYEIVVTFSKDLPASLVIPVTPPSLPAALGKPLDRTTTGGNGTSVFDFFGKSERKTEVASEHVVFESEHRTAPQCSQDSQQTKRRRSSRLKTSSENPIEIDDSDDDVGSTRSVLDKRVSVP